MVLVMVGQGAAPGMEAEVAKVAVEQVAVAAVAVQLHRRARVRGTAPVVAANVHAAGGRVGAGGGVAQACGVRHAAKAHGSVAITVADGERECLRRQQMHMVPGSMAVVAHMAGGVLGISIQAAANG